MQRLESKVEQALKTVYDPDFPIVDIYTLWLIYSFDIKPKEHVINVVMSFTTPACPMADYLTESVKNAINTVASNYEVKIEITFDPMWSPEMIRDEDLKRMFE